MASTTTEKKGLNRLTIRVAALVMMFIIAASSMITVAALTGNVTIKDGETLTTVAVTNKDLSKETDLNWFLNYAKITVNQYDQIVWEESTGTLTIKRAFPVTLTADGSTATREDFVEGTVQDALTKFGITLGSRDKVEPSLDTDLTPGMADIAVTRGYPVNVTVDGETKMLDVFSGTTVEKALTDSGIALGSEDIISAERTQKITGPMDITVDRVGYRDVTTTEEVPYETVRIETEDLLKGETQVQTAGVCGVRTIVTKERMINGEVAETQEVSNEVTTQPVTQELLVGTKVKVKATGYAQIKADGILIDENGNVVSYSSVYTGGCTAYTSYGGSGTASGRPAQYGNIAVNPNVIPYGTRLYVCSPNGSYVYGYAVAADTGGAMLSGQCLADLYYETESECYSFGRRQMSIYILN